MPASPARPSAISSSSCAPSPAPRRSARRLGARARRSVARRSRTGCRSSTAGPIRDGRPVELPKPDSRPSDDADRQRRSTRGRAGARLVAATTSRSCWTPSAPRRASRSRTSGCRRTCAHGWRSSRARARGSSRRATPSDAGSSATSTTARSSGSSRCRSRCGFSPRGFAPDADAAALLAERARGAGGLDHSELRELAQGIHPAVLSDHGLAVALESLATRAPLDVDLSVGSTSVRLPQAEVAAYYLVRRRSRTSPSTPAPRSATVDVARVTGAWSWRWPTTASVERTRERGSGLRGLADRVEALDGRCASGARRRRGRASGRRSRARSARRRRRAACARAWRGCSPRPASTSSARARPLRSSCARSTPTRRTSRSSTSACRRRRRTRVCARRCRSARRIRRSACSSSPSTPTSASR